jgi:hypothetical protein
MIVASMIVPLFHSGVNAKMKRALSSSKIVFWMLKHASIICSSRTPRFADKWIS